MPSTFSIFVDSLPLGFRSSVMITSIFVGSMTSCERPETNLESAAAGPPVESSAEAAPSSSSGAIIYPSGSVTIRAGATAVYGDPADVDFGLVPPGSKLRTEIKLVNPTDKPVIIRAAVPTCQCTTVEVAGETIPPRGAVGIPMTLQVPSTTGDKKAAVNTVLDPGGKGPRLTLQAVSAYPVRSIPLYIDATQPPAGMTGSFRVESTDGQSFQVLSLNGRPAVTGGSGTAATSHEVFYDLTGETAETMPKWMLVETDHPEAPMIEMRVRHRWSMLPHQFPNYDLKIQFDGYVANVGVLPLNGSREFTVELKNFKGQTLRALRSVDRRFPVRLLQQIAGDGSRVRVTASISDANATPGPFISPVGFVTDRGEEIMFVIGTVR